MALTQRNETPVGNVRGAVGRVGNRLGTWGGSLQSPLRRAAGWLRRHRTLAVGLVAGLVVVGAASAYVWQEGVPDELEDAVEGLWAKPTLKELRRSVAMSPKDAELRARLGHAHFEAGKRTLGVRDYERALALDSKVASEQMASNLVSCYGRSQQRRAAALIARYKMKDAEEGLRKVTRTGGPSARNAALTTLDRLGQAQRGDFLAVWTKDLDAKDCETRKGAVDKLAKLGDKRAVEALRAAKKRSDAEATLFWSCLGNGPVDAEKQILAAR